MTPALNRAGMPLLDYIQEISTEFQRPVHLGALVHMFESARRGEPIRALITYPIRHFKTETVLHGCLWLLEHEPTLRIVIMTYSKQRAVWIGKRLRVLAKRTPVGPKKGHDTIEEWENDQGGGVVVMSAEQSREGYDCHVLLVDDPLDEHSAREQEKRDAVDTAIAHYTTRCKRFIKGKGYVSGPVIIVMSRWNDDDPIKRRERRTKEPWQKLWSPAVLDDPMRPFAPDLFSLEDLAREREILKESDPRERTWFARYMGQPVPDNPSSFGEFKRYSTLPEWPGFTEFIGLDMSFSKNHYADYTAIAVIRWMYGLCYVREIRRARGLLTDLAQMVRDVRLQYGPLPMFSEVSGPEKAALAYLAKLGLSVQPKHAGEPKFIRAQPLIDAHNAGIVLWPHAPWVTEALMGRFKKFSGNENDCDDEVDALSSVFNCTRVINSNVVPIALGRRRM